MYNKDASQNRPTVLHGREDLIGFCHTHRKGLKSFNDSHG